jgi:hypothetical protein|tara:strand:- start:263 stop:412 length:150 start_codon:yes stop_codon:yes gene_type:complete
MHPFHTRVMAFAHVVGKMIAPNSRPMTFSVRRPKISSAALRVKTAYSCK